MRKIFTLFLALVILAGCSTEIESFLETEPVSGVISLYSDEGLENESQTPRVSRTAVSAEESLTYTFEAWTRDSNPECVLHKTVNGTLTGAAIEIRLVPGNYDFLFWADYGKAYYTTDNLRHVGAIMNNENGALTYTPGKQRDAFACVKSNVNWNGGNGLSVKLSRPVAKLMIKNNKQFIEAGKKVSAIYRNVPTEYDVLTGKASVPETVELTFPQTTAGTEIAGEDFIFVPSEGYSIDLTIEVGDVKKYLDVLTVKPNFMTCVTAAWE